MVQANTLQHASLSRHHRPARAARLPAAIAQGLPLTALAPMQDVTDLAFMQVIARYGPPDYFFTEFFRVHAQSRPEKHILCSITENTTDRPVFAQIIGESVPDILRTVRALLACPVAGIDFNLGCPAPKIYRKQGWRRAAPRPRPHRPDSGRAPRGGARAPHSQDEAGFRRCREISTGSSSSSTGMSIDLLTVHGRTVKEMYHGDVHYDLIARAVRQVRCPVLANGNITSADPRRGRGRSRPALPGS